MKSIDNSKESIKQNIKPKKQVFKKVKKKIINIKPRKVRRNEKKINPNSPFAVLQKLL